MWKFCGKAKFLHTLGACDFIKKETLAQVFSCEFYEISKNTFFYRTPLMDTCVFGNVTSSNTRKCRVRQK